MNYKTFKISKIGNAVLAVCLFFGLELSVGFAEVSEKMTDHFLSEGWEEVNKVPSDPSLNDVGKQMFYSLSLVLLLLCIGAFIFKYVYHGKMSGGPKETLKLIKVIEKYHLNPRQSILLIWVVDRLLVVSNCQGRLEILSEVEHKNASDLLPEEFTNVLNQSQLSFSGVYHG